MLKAILAVAAVQTAPVEAPEINLYDRPARTVTDFTVRPEFDRVSPKEPRISISRKDPFLELGKGPPTITSGTILRYTEDNVTVTLGKNSRETQGFGIKIPGEDGPMGKVKSYGVGVKLSF